MPSQCTYNRKLLKYNSYLKYKTYKTYKEIIFIQKNLSKKLLKCHWSTIIQITFPVFARFELNNVFVSKFQSSLGNPQVTGIC